MLPTQSDRNKKLFVGPYKNEFGHELFSFQGRVRALAEDYEEVTVCSNPAMEYLYQDFAGNFISNNESVDLTRYHDYDILNQKEFEVSSGKGLLKGRQVFTEYGQPCGESYDVIFHARTKKVGMCPNVPVGVWDCVFEGLRSEYKIAFMGTSEEAYCPDGARDLRGTALSDLANIIHSSILVVGYSSGPIHFASLCKTPHLTWGGHRVRTFFRYAHNWNPFKTSCYIFENLKEIGYLKRRARLFGVPQSLFEQKHLTIIDDKNYRQPTVNSLLRAIRKILNG